MPDPNPSERLAEIEARVEAATPKPWIQDGGTWRTPHGYAMALVNWVNDASFIAHAREDIPWLLADNARLREVLTWISDSSYVGNYAPLEIVEIHRKWATNALVDSGEASG